ncbi:MAG: signal peptide peptidase SppA [Patescibacteria group bacterium]|nr:signal peptide peptidase SppA [Patescibacteria group bacterium]
MDNEQLKGLIESMKKFADSGEKYMSLQSTKTQGELAFMWFKGLALFSVVFFSIGMIATKMYYSFRDPHEAPMATAMASEHVRTDNFNREYVTLASTQNSVALIKFAGAITDPSADALLQKLRYAEKDPTVKAVVLDITSPGGDVVPSDIVHHEIKKMQKSGKKVVAFYDGLTASGAVYMSASADRIVATPTGIFGSIGVIMEGMEYADLMQKLGVRSTVIKSGKEKDINSPMRHVTPEDRAVNQRLVDQMYKRFVTTVSSGRHLPMKTVYGFADGSVWCPEDAKALGLIDQIGYEENAIDAAKELIKDDKASVIRITDRPSPLGLFAMKLGRLTSAFAAQLANSSPNNTMEYVWKPAL